MTGTGQGHIVRLLDGLAHPSTDASVDQIFHGRLVAVFGVVAAVTALAAGLAVTELLGVATGAVPLGYCAAVLATLLALRLGLSPAAGFWVLEVLTALHFVALLPGGEHFDWTLVMWLCVFPMLAMLQGGLPAGRWGFLVTVLAAMAMAAKRQLGWAGAQPLPPVAQAISAAAFIGAMSAIAAISETLRREAMAQAHRAAGARTLFLANMSHELRTPMNGVIGITDLLLAAPQPEPLRSQLELVRRSGIQLVALVNDILDLTRIESGRLTLESMALDLRALLEDVVNLLRPGATEKGLTLGCDVASSVPRWVLGDPTRLRQVATNLLANAVKFTTRGEVRVRAYLQGEHLRLEVRDSGIGLSVEAQARLFTPFEQGDVSTTRRFGGSGLGLALSRRLVTAMKGTLGVVSRPGQGSTFWVEMPCRPCPAPVAEPSRRSPLPTLRPLRVLVAEDNAINRAVAVGMLQRCGCTVELVEDGAGAVQAVARSAFDLVLMDCHMPGMDGFDATRQIRELPGDAASTLVVALTASALAEDLQRCLEAGMNDVLTKPMTLATLRKLLAGLGGGVERGVRATPPELA